MGNWDEAVSNAEFRRRQHLRGPSNPSELARLEEEVEEVKEELLRVEADIFECGLPEELVQQLERYRQSLLDRLNAIAIERTQDHSKAA